MNLKLFTDLYNRSIDLLPNTCNSQDTGKVQYEYTKTCIDWLHREDYISETQYNQLLEQVKDMTIN